MAKPAGNYCFLISGYSKLVHQNRYQWRVSKVIPAYLSEASFNLQLDYTGDKYNQLILRLIVSKDDINDEIGTIGLQGKTAHISIDVILGCSLGDLCSQVSNLC